MQFYYNSNIFLSIYEILVVLFFHIFLADINSTKSIWKWPLIPAMFILPDSSSFWSLLHFPLSSVPPLTVAIDFGDKQPSKSHCMLPKISKLHDGLRQIAIYIYPWMSSVCDSLLMPLYQMAGCKTDINWDKCLGSTNEDINVCHIATQIVVIFRIWCKIRLLLNFSLILNRLLFIFVFKDR